MSISSITDVTVLQKMIEDNGKKTDETKKNGIVYRDRYKVLEAVVLVAKSAAFATVGGMHLLSVTGTLAITFGMIKTAGSIALLVLALFYSLLGVTHYQRTRANTQVKEYSKIVNEAENRIKEIADTARKVA